MHVIIMLNQEPVIQKLLTLDYKEEMKISSKMTAE